jgi:hypothetical protein
MQQTIACGKERKKERVLKPCEFSAVPSGLLNGAFQTQDYVLGYFQTSLRDLLQSFMQTEPCVFPWKLVQVLRWQGLKPDSFLRLYGTTKVVP